MAHFLNHGTVSNQPGTQIVHGNIVFQDPGSSHKRLRLNDDGSILDQSFDDDILASLAFPQMFHRRSDVESAHPQTCQWLFNLEKFQKWNNATCGLLWIKGKPGSGKSTLISHLYRNLWLRRQVDCDINLEFFFSARGAALQRSFIGMLRSLLNQLFKQDPTVRQGLRASFLEKRSSFGSGQASWEWTLPELKDLFTDMILASAKHKQIVLLVDALDESGEEAAKDIASFFHTVTDSVSRSSGQARICISCRHYPIASYVETVEIWVETHNHDDVALYVKDCLSNQNFIVDATQQNLHIITEALVTKAEGVFQWVCLMIPRLKKWLSEGETTDQVLKSLSEVPQNLEAVYEDILTKKIDPRYLKKTLRLFQWICLASRPLSIPELRYALSADSIKPANIPMKCCEVSDFEKSDSIMPHRVTAWSGGLLETKLNESLDPTSSSSQIVQVIHQSVNDFIVARGLALLLALNNDTFDTTRQSPLLMKPARAAQMSHGTLYRSCLNYLSSDLSCEDTSTLHMVRESNPFFEYATRFALTHAEQSGACRDFDLEVESRLLSQSIPTWTLVARMESHDVTLTRKYPRMGCTVLYLASIMNSTDLAEYRIHCGDDINERDGSGWTAMCAAASRGHLAMVTLLHGYGADIHSETYDGETPLLIAARRRHTETFRFLLHHGADLNKEHGKNGSALHTAALHGSIAISRLCMDAGADVNAVGGEYGTALQAAAAAFDENEAIVHFLLDAGADVDATGGIYGNALQAAAFKEYTTIVKVLLDAGADANAIGGRYGTALQAAAASTAFGGNVTIVKFLLDAGADVNATGGQYGTALQAAAAAFAGGDTIIEILLDAGADINATGGEFGTALQAAAAAPNGGNKTVVKFLLDAGADVSTIGGTYGTALQAAAAYEGGTCGTALQAAAAYEGNEAITKMILNAGADVNATGGKYGNALQAAAYRGNQAIVELLLDAGADVNAAGGMYGNALQAAAAAAATYGESEAIAKILLDAGADVNATGGIHGTALQAVASAPKRDNEAIFKVLLDAGANVNATGGTYGSALQAATFRQNHAVIRLLLDAGADPRSTGSTLTGNESLTEHISTQHQDHRLSENSQCDNPANENVNELGSFWLLQLLNRFFT